MSDSGVRETAWSYVLEQPAQILLADDDPILCEFAAVYLSTPTATIVTAPDGMAALDLLRATPFDCAVLDIEMPALDGFALLQRMRADEALRHLPVMMLTGHEDIASIDRAFMLGANAFSSKPVNWRLLSYQIKYMLRSCSLERLVGASDSTIKRTMAEHKLLRERCEAILAEARRGCQATGMPATALETDSLRRIVKLASEVLEGNVFAAACHDAASRVAAAAPGVENAAA
jgi:DNA-binding response OmpR family regulator